MSHEVKVGKMSTGSGERGFETFRAPISIKPPVDLQAGAILAIFGADRDSVRLFNGMVTSEATHVMVESSARDRERRARDIEVISNRIERAVNSPEELAVMADEVAFPKPEEVQQAPRARFSFLRRN